MAEPIAHFVTSAFLLSVAVQQDPHVPWHRR